MEGWEVVKTNQGRPLYFNPTMGVSTYEKPAAVKEVEVEDRERSNIAAILKEQDEAGESSEDLFLAVPRRQATTGYLDEDIVQASTDVALSSSNVGYKMLQKMGWKGEGKGVGKQGREGVSAPITLRANDAQLGLGKQAEYDKATEDATRERRKLEVEREETPELVQQRAEQALALQARAEQVKEMNRPFYCVDCDKQYKCAMEYSAHLSSYDHHHVKRFRDMQKAQKQGIQASQTKRKRNREQKREERELKALMARANAATAAAATAAAGAPIASAALARDGGSARTSSGAGAVSSAISMPAVPSRPAGKKMKLSFKFGKKRK